MDDFNVGLGRADRDDGFLAVDVANPEFKDQFRQRIINLARGWEGTCEDIRENWTGTQPTHPNAWGSVWGWAIRAGLLIELPQRVSMRARKSHARRTHLCRRT